MLVVNKDLEAFFEISQYISTCTVTRYRIRFQAAYVAYSHDVALRIRMYTAGVMRTKNDR